MQPSRSPSKPAQLVVVVVVVVAAYLLHSSAASLVRARPEVRPSAPTIGEPSAGSACDLLLAEIDTLVPHCQCDDENPETLPPTSASGASATLHVGQLACGHGSHGLALEQVADSLAQVSKHAYTINHLSLVGQLDVGRRPEERPHAARRLRAAHLSLQLSFVAQNTSSRHGADLGVQVSSYLADLSLEDALEPIRSVSILLAGRLGLVADAGDDEDDYDKHPKGADTISGNQISINACTSPNQTVIQTNPTQAVAFDAGHLLGQFRSLERFEISTQAALQTQTLSALRADLIGVSELIISAATLRDQTKLRWLNLASNRALRLDADALRACKLLEHINVESNKLEHFPVLHLFSVEFDAQTVPDELELGNKLKPDSQVRYFGLAHLRSLNLANNRLGSLSRDLFSAIVPTAATSTATKSTQSQTNLSATRTTQLISLCKSHLRTNGARENVFILPAMSELDLSRNRFELISHNEAQELLCTMPNLSQLYLHQNRIVQLALGSLLHAPLHQIGPKSVMMDSSDHIDFGLSSRLEYIDLSQNHLVRLIVRAPPNGDRYLPASGNGQAALRLRSVNFGRNHLPKTLQAVDWELLDRISFNDFGASQSPADRYDAVGSIETVIDLGPTNTSTPMSICDFLSPSGGLASATLQIDPSLSELTYSFNRLRQVRATDFNSVACRSVQTLRLDNNQIFSINPDAFGSMIGLEELDLSDNYMVSLPSGVFRNNTKLRTLDLAANRLKLLDSFIFDTLINLEEMFLQGNQIHQLDKRIFTHNPLLSTIDLSENRLSAIQNSTFARQQHLRMIDLFGNSLKEYLPFEVHSASTENASGKSSSEVPTNQISSNAKTTTLSADPKQAAVKRPKGKSKSKKRNQKSDKFSRHKRLAIELEEKSALVLSHNQLEAFKGSQCQAIGSSFFLNEVEYLWLDHNKLIEINSTTFGLCAKSMKHLHLEHNLIKNIHPNAFVGMLRLELVNLSHNRLSQFDLTLAFDLIQTHQDLRYLDMSWNYLMSLNLPARRNANVSISVPLESLDLSHNKLLSIDLESVLTAFNSLRSLDLSALGELHIAPSTTGGATAAAAPTQLDYLNLSHNQPLNDSLFGASSLLDNMSINELSLASSDVSKETSKSTLIKTRTQFLVKKLQSDLAHLDLTGLGLTSGEVSSIFEQSQTGANLVSLNISSNSLHEWPFEAHKNPQVLLKLEHINLSSNRLRYLIKGHLHNYALSSLRYLNMSHNSMIGLIESPSLRINGLDCLMPRLELVDLSHNRLTWLPLKFFDRLMHLKMLSLRHNNLGPALLAPLSLHDTARDTGLLLDLGSNPKLEGLSPSQDRSRWFSAHQTDFSNQPEVDDVPPEDLILVPVVRADSSVGLRCTYVDEVVEWLKAVQSDINPASDGRPKKHLRDPSGFELSSSSFSTAGQGVWDDEQKLTRERRCTNLINRIDQVNLDASAQVDRLLLKHLWLQSGRKLHLSLAYKAISEVDTVDSSQLLGSTVYLNLGHNKLSSLPHNFCNHANNLMSLSLHHNSFKTWPNGLNNSCRQLSYLNLSSNRLESLSRNVWTINSMSVLDLSKNHIARIELATQAESSALRYIDLRYNKLKSDLQIVSLLSRQPLLQLQSDQQKIFADEFVELVERVDRAIAFGRPKVKLDSSSIQLIWPTSIRANYTLSLPSSLSDKSTERLPENVGQVFREGVAHKIKFCMISTRQENNITQICIKPSQGNEISAEDTCFLLKLPTDAPSCLTHLSHETRTNRTSSRKVTDPDSSHLIGNTTMLLTDSSETSGGASVNNDDDESDLVLNVINSIKYNWLKLRHVAPNVNEYLMSLVDTKDDPLWLNIGDKYPIRKMTVIKTMIVVGAASIVALLLAVFILLVQFSIGANKSDQMSPRSVSEMTDTKDERQQSESVQCGTNSSSQSGSGESTGSSGGSKRRAGSLMTKSGSTHSTGMSQQSGELNTVVENNHNFTGGQQLQQQIQQHAAAIQMQQLQPTCLTPSSSLAPSSIETVETLQAIDSIQSNHSNVNANLQDSYPQVQTQANPYAYQQPPTTATVMRIVKSSSANFNSAQAGLGAQLNEHQTYGTLDKRYSNYSNYSVLKSRLNQMHSSQQHKYTKINNLPDHQSQQQRQPHQQHYSTMDHDTNSIQSNYTQTGSNKYATLNSSSLGVRDATAQSDIDPTTLSLLSINTALSSVHNNNGNNINTGGSQQISPASTVAPERQLLRGQTSGTQPNQSLCEYHRLLQQDNGPVNAGTGNGDLADDMWMPPPPNVILEQDENDLEQQNGDILYNGELLLHVSQLPPPPPQV